MSMHYLIISSNLYIWTMSSQEVDHTTKGHTFKPQAIEMALENVYHVPNNQPHETLHNNITQSTYM